MIDKVKSLNMQIKEYFLTNKAVFLSDYQIIEILKFKNLSKIEKLDKKAYITPKEAKKILYIYEVKESNKKYDKKKGKKYARI